MKHTLKNLGLATLLVGTIACGEDAMDTAMPSVYDHQKIALAKELGLCHDADGIVFGTIAEEQRVGGYALRIDTPEGQRYVVSIVDGNEIGYPNTDALSLALKVGSKVNFATKELNAGYETDFFNAVHMGKISTCYIAPAPSEK